MSVVTLEMHGLLGLLILWASVGLFLAHTLIGRLWFWLNKAKYANAEHADWSKCFYWSGFTLLIIDLVFLALMAQSCERSISPEDGANFDWQMFNLWIPLHILAYLVIAGIFKIIRLKKPEIDTFIERLR